MRYQWIAVLITALWASAGWAQTQPRLLVLDFEATEGIEPALVNIANDTFITTLNSFERFELATSDDVRMMLSAEAEAALSGCDDQSCMADVAGALGARYLSRGRLSLLDDHMVLTLQLFDTNSAKLESQVTDDLPSRSSEIGPKVEEMTYALMKVERVVAPKWYENTWVWVGAGVLVAGTVTAVILASGGDEEVPNLGRFPLD